MELPFPGMDPYLEQPSLWPDVHSSLIAAMRDTLQAQIALSYVARITPYVALEQIDIAVPRRAIVPNVGVYERDLTGVSPAAATITAPSLTGTALMEIPTRYARIEIRAVNDETLVTAIELLSPVNKRPGADGADAYEKKRQELFQSGVHLLEIDLLRGGRRPQLAPSTVLPAAPYVTNTNNMRSVMGATPIRVHALARLRHDSSPAHLFLLYSATMSTSSSGASKMRSSSARKASIFVQPAPVVCVPSIL